MPLIETDADAVVMIGDRAMHPPRESFVEIWDLGDEWCRWSELSFVFAMWVARAGVELDGIESALAAARDDGLAHLPEIAAAEAPHVGLTANQALVYLRDNLYFYLGPREERGLALFHRKAAELRLAPRISPSLAS
jgi:chorismate dehydratase